MSMSFFKFPFVSRVRKSVVINLAWLKSLSLSTDPHGELRYLRTTGHRYFHLFPFCLFLQYFKRSPLIGITGSVMYSATCTLATALIFLIGINNLTVLFVSWI